MIVSLPLFGEAPITISGFHETTTEITVRRVGHVTSELFKLKRGGHIFLRGPYGNKFPLDRFAGKDLLLIATGTGVAAIKSLADFYQKPGEQSVKRLDVLAGFRTPRHVLFQQELKVWERASNVIVTVNKNEDDDESWAGGIGFVVSFVKEVQHIGPETEVVIVGPPPMMKNTIAELMRHSIRKENIWLSFERHMKCGLGKCGHCRIRDKYVCIDGPVFNYVEATRLVD